ncbi:MAG: xanthine dehydrogenase family protein subunit M [bacterium]|nr:oxidoreductase [Deltaproteobacteria bacterium]MCP4907914.1 xanthine dehydrogenase family protein subunit M [bacterium]
MRPEEYAPLSQPLSQRESRFEAPTEVDGAVALLQAEEGARILAGGTDLLVQMRLGAGSPALFVDVKRIPRLMAMTVDASGLTLGAAVPAAEIFENEAIKDLWPGLAEAIYLIGSTQVQGRATVSGNLCNASPGADSVPALIACRAIAVIVGPKGEREVAIEEFTTGPGQTVLERGELVVEFKIPVPAPHASDAYQRLTPRTEMDIAVVGVGVSLELDGDGVVSSARVVLGAVGPKVICAEASAAALVGTRLEDAALEAVAEAASAAATPIDDKRGTAVYRKRVTGVLAKRVARVAYERAKSR